MSFGRHLKALLWKNWLLWKRKIGGSAWEILFPIILMGLVAFIRTLITNTDYPTEMHIQSSTVYTVSDPTWQQAFWKDLQLSNPKIIPNQFDLQRFANKYSIVGTNKALNQELRDYLDLSVIRFFAAYYKLQVDYVEYDTESHLFDYIIKPFAGSLHELTINLIFKWISLN